MLTPSSATQVFGETFSITITVSSSEPGATPEDPPVETPSTEVPTVIRSFTDPGVTVTTGPGTVTIAGKYTSILPIMWKWIDLTGAEKSGVAPPEEGTYSKIFQMDAPPSLSEYCVYIIGGDMFVHTVTLVTYDTLKNKLLDLLAKAP